MPNLQGTPGGQNRDIHLTFLGPRLQRGYQVPPRDITTGRYVTITKPRSALLHSAIRNVYIRELHLSTKDMFDVLKRESETLAVTGN